MRKLLPALLFCAALSGALPAAAISRADFDRVVDFSVTLKDLAAAADGTARLPTGRLCVLNGTVSDVDISSKDEATFRVRIELITGEWIGTEDVRSYSCYVDFSGPEFFKIFPARPPRSPVPGTVVINSRVIVVGRALDITQNPQGEKRVRVEGMFVRPVE